MTLLPAVASLIDDFNLGPLTLYRKAAPTLNSYGEHVAASETAIQLNPVAAHNLTGRDLLKVPEANRNTEVLQFYTKVRIYVADGSQAADEILYQGRRWTVIGVQDYQLQGGCWIAQAVLEDTQAP